VSVPEPPEDKPTHPIATVPPPTLASPHHIDFGDGPERWWTPSWQDIMPHIGWRWVLVLPVVVVSVLFVIYVLLPRWIRGRVSWISIFGRYAMMFVALPFVVVGYAISKAVSGRKDPFCIHCGYGLNGLPDHHRCPECGMPYEWATIEEYRRDPKWFIKRWRERHKIPANHGGVEAGPVRSPRSRDGT
jgi:hypothetical protein